MSMEDMVLAVIILIGCLLLKEVASINEFYDFHKFLALITVMRWLSSWEIGRKWINTLD